MTPTRIVRLFGFLGLVVFMGLVAKTSTATQAVDDGLTPPPPPPTPIIERRFRRSRSLAHCSCRKSTLLPSHRKTPSLPRSKSSPLPV